MVGTYLRLDLEKSTNVHLNYSNVNWQNIKWCLLLQHPWWILKSWLARSLSFSPSQRWGRLCGYEGIFVFWYYLSTNGRHDQTSCDNQGKIRVAVFPSYCLQLWFYATSTMSSLYLFGNLDILFWTYFNFIKFSLLLLM